MKKIYKLIHLKELNKLNKLKEHFSTLLFNVAILIFIIGFGFRDTPTPFGWYQQFMPSMGNKQIADITFLDSLTGIAVANNYPSDSNYVLRTTNGGDNWNIIYRQYFPMQHIQFLNQNTGFACAGYLYKTTDEGYTWNNINTSGISAGNMYILNQDTIWLIDSDALVGGVFRTTNGGVSWDQQINWGISNPSKIYMFNARIGFIGSGAYIAKTTDGGSTWNLINGETGFIEIHFIDSLTGWKSGPMKKTTDGGLTWVAETLPHGGIIQTNGIGSFSVVNKDTIWGNGGYVLYPNNQIRQILNRTTNGGDNWLFQIPDTASIPFIAFGGHINFINKFIGWGTGSSEIHTLTGGDTTFLTAVNKAYSKIPDLYKLIQNYPNPFNPETKIKYQIKSNVKSQTSYVKINIYDISGKRVITLVDDNQNPGEYEVTFDGSNYSSGIYFYSLFADGVLIDTKKMILLK